MDVQFAPEAALPAHAKRAQSTRARTRAGLQAGFAALAGLLAEKGFEEAIFESKNPVLMRSMEKRTGFVRSPGEMVCALERSSADVRE